MIEVISAPVRISYLPQELTWLVGKSDESALNEIIGRHNPGDELTLRVFRNGNVETVSVTLTAAR